MPVPQGSIEAMNRASLAAPQHKNAGAFTRLPPDQRPANGAMLEALDKALGGRRKVTEAIGERLVGLPSGYHGFVLVALWEEHCFGE